ncbi:hypothetical protein HY995_04305 [Candidatus Micrarchaeota archaeon]|nr:hypothetical protein [Candidatus Micrarchaeota archaeon]MBI5177278.1 hypothetical protein [Candidatus Micrarchaeota archaeon]
MKIPICQMCAATEFLCSGCAAKLAKGTLSQADVDASRALYALNRQGADLDGVELVRAIDAKRLAYLFLNSPESRLVGPQGRTIRKLEKLMKSTHVRAVRLGKGPLELAGEILFPAKVLGINKAYSAGGETLKVRTAKRDAVKLPSDLESLGGVLQFALGKKCKITFE